MRYNAEETNKLFLKLPKWVVNQAAVELLKMVISSVYKTRTKSEFNAKTQVMNDITKHNEKIARARRLLLDEEIEPSDYKEIKADCDAVIARLEVKLQETSETKMIRLDINKLMDKIVTTFCNLDKVFQKAPLKKQKAYFEFTFS